MDQLTGLPTHLDLPQVLAERYESSSGLTAILFDIAEFKPFNAERGHLEGDALLVRIGAWLAPIARRNGGETFRVGGDEFLFLLPHTRREDAVAVAREALSGSEAGLNAVVFATPPGFENSMRQLRDDCADAIYKAKAAEGKSSSLIVEM